MRDDCAHTFVVGGRTLREIETSLRLAVRSIDAVTGETVVRENRANLLVERNFVRGKKRGNTDEGQNEQGAGKHECAAGKMIMTAANFSQLVNPLDLTKT